MVGSLQIQALSRYFPQEGKEGSKHWQRYPWTSSLGPSYPLSVPLDAENLLCCG